MTFEILTVVLLRIQVFWDVTVVRRMVHIVAKYHNAFISKGSAAQEIKLPHFWSHQWTQTSRTSFLVRLPL